jgi:hypothetical protein
VVLAVAEAVMTVVATALRSTTRRNSSLSKSPSTTRSKTQYNGYGATP